MISFVFGLWIINEFEKFRIIHESSSFLLLGKIFEHSAMKFHHKQADEIYIFCWSITMIKIKIVFYCFPFCCKVPLWSKKPLPFFLQILKVCLLNIWLAKFWALIFIQRPFTLSVSFGFHGPPYSRSKLTDWTSEGWIQEKVMSEAH